MNIPQNLMYTKDHEWARIEGNTAVIGVSEYATHSLGDLVFVELPEMGRSLKAHETFGVVESVKAVSDLFAPLSGKVIARNEAVVSDPSIINQDSYDKGWLIKIELTNKDADLKNMLDPKAYAQIAH